MLDMASGIRVPAMLGDVLVSNVPAIFLLGFIRFFHSDVRLSINLGFEIA